MRGSRELPGAGSPLGPAKGGGLVVARYRRAAGAARLSSPTPRPSFPPPARCNLHTTRPARISLAETIPTAVADWCFSSQVICMRRCGEPGRPAAEKLSRSRRQVSRRAARAPSPPQPPQPSGGPATCPGTWRLGPVRSGSARRDSALERRLPPQPSFPRQKMAEGSLPAGWR